MDTISKTNESIAEHQGEVDELAKAYSAAAEESGVLSDSQNKATDSVEAATTAISELEAEYTAAQESAKTSIDSQIGLLDELEIKSSKSASEIVENWGKQSEALEDYKTNMQKAIEMGLDEALVKQLSDGSTESMAILDELVNDTDVNVDEINTAFRKTEESKQSVAGVMADIQTDTSKKLDAIAQDMEYEWSGMADTVGDAIAEAQAYIDSLTGKTVYNRVITQYSTQGSPSTGSSSGSSTAAASAASVPFLAKGTVIPPNAPFLAVLGDQRHGTNVEAPLATIQEAVAAVMGDQVSAMMAGFNALLEENKLLRQIVENIELGDTTIGQAANRYQQKVAVMRGG